MINYFLFFATAFIWGSTWLAIQFQLSTVSPIWSIIYRFGLSSAILFCLCLAKRLHLKFTWAQHRMLMLQGLLMFSLNYVLYYLGSEYFISGLVAVIFASIIVLNIFNSWLFFRTRLSWSIVLGALLGLAGLAVIFTSQFKLILHYEDTDRILTGISICLLGTFVASLGNISSVYVQKKQLPILPSTAFAMLYGTLFVALLALAFQIKPTFDLTHTYVGSLAYLSIVGTVLGFTIYLRLLGNIGPERAAYAFVVLPIVSLLLSSEFEGFEWTLQAILGVGLVLLGNALVLQNVRPREETYQLKNIFDT